MVHSNTQNVKLDVRKQKKDNSKTPFNLFENAYIYSNINIFIYEKHKNAIISYVFDSTVAHENLHTISDGSHTSINTTCDIKVTWAARVWQESWKENQMCFNLHQCKDLHWFKRGG